MTSANALLGLPEEPALRAMVLAAAKASETGITPRELARRFQKVDALTWMEACASLNRAGLLAHTWVPCKGGGGATLQESSYALASGAPGPAA